MFLNKVLFLLYIKICIQGCPKSQLYQLISPAAKKLTTSSVGNFDSAVERKKAA